MKTVIFTRTKLNKNVNLIDRVMVISHSILLNYLHVIYQNLS